MTAGMTGVKRDLIVSKEPYASLRREAFTYDGCEHLPRTLMRGSWDGSESGMLSREHILYREHIRYRDGSESGLPDSALACVPSVYQAPDEAP
jgi:hypothetical protein